MATCQSAEAPGGNAFSRGALYELLSNPVYIGEIRHKGARHPGLHDAIIERDLWDKTQLSLRSRAVAENAGPLALTGEVLGIVTFAAFLICANNGQAHRVTRAQREPAASALQST
jgi:hypothetical protein